MTIAEFLENAKFYKDEEENFLNTICKTLGDCVSCDGCPFYTECEKAGDGYYCEDILKKYLTIK